MREVHRTNRKETWCSDKIRDSKRGQFTGIKPKTTNLSTNSPENPTGGGDSDRLIGRKIAKKIQRQPRKRRKINKKIFTALGFDWSPGSYITNRSVITGLAGECFDGWGRGAV